MSRLAAFAGAVICAFSLACSSAVVQQPLDLPSGCVEVTDSDFNLNVDDQALVVPGCIGIRKGKTTLTWTGGSNVSVLLIAFKANPDPRPDRPNCVNATCTLKRAKHASKQGDFYYSVVVIRPDGTTKTIDPRLIIQP